MDSFSVRVFCLFGWFGFFLCAPEGSLFVVREASGLWERWGREAKNGLMLSFCPVATI